jgi:hypothetical protein
MATCVVTVNDILDGHVGLDLECGSGRSGRADLSRAAATLTAPRQLRHALRRRFANSRFRRRPDRAPDGLHDHR